MSLLSWLSKFKKTPLVAENESSLSVGCDAPSTSKRPPTDSCSVLRSVDTDDAMMRQVNDCSSAAISGTSIPGATPSTSLIELPMPVQSSITPLESAQSLFPQHVQKLWTSMHNSAYDCDRKNLIAPLNSLGTLEIYHVIKTAN